MGYRLYYYLAFFIFVWFIGSMVFLLKYFVSIQSMKGIQLNKNKVVTEIQKLENEIAEQTKFYKSIILKLHKIKDLSDKKVSINTEKYGQVLESQILLPVVPVLIFSCNRGYAIRKSLELLIKYRPSQYQFPIIVCQDCGDVATKNVILSFKDQVSLIEQPDLSPISVPIKEKKFAGYFHIARNYKFGLNYIFKTLHHEAVIIVEDDLEISPDFFSYFSATYPLLKTDPSLFCISAWNDNGKKELIDISHGEKLLYRTDFFPGLGWMLIKDSWDELEPKWPRSYWDDWIRAEKQRKGRSCIRPEISRTRTFGKKGVSNGMFFERHLKNIVLNKNPVDFSTLNITALTKDIYDESFLKEVYESPEISLNAVLVSRNSNLGDEQSKTYRLLYHNHLSYKKITKALKLMDDFKEGVPRTAYHGIITFYYNERRIYLCPSWQWKGYDPSWA